MITLYLLTKMIGVKVMDRKAVDELIDTISDDKLRVMMRELVKVVEKESKEPEPELEHDMSDSEVNCFVDELTEDVIQKLKDKKLWSSTGLQRRPSELAIKFAVTNACGFFNYKSLMASIAMAAMATQATPINKDKRGNESKDVTKAWHLILDTVGKWAERDSD